MKIKKLDKFILNSLRGGYGDARQEMMLDGGPKGAEREPPSDPREN